MKLEALKFGPGGGTGLENCTIDAASARAIEALKDGELPCAYVIRSSDLERISVFGEVVADRGKRHPKTPLRKTLLGRRKIQLIDGAFINPKPLWNSVNKLLEKAMEKKEKNVYIIGVKGPIFEKLLSAGNGPGASGPTRRPTHRRSQRKDTRYLNDDGYPGSLMSLMGFQEVPPKLKETFIGESGEAEKVRQFILRAADIEYPVLIHGDTGTGKEIVAREIHNNSSRRKGSFVEVNCGAISRELFEPELFGYTRGSHSTAFRSKKGMWEEADGGTLFLDELGELSLDHQAKILRAAQEGMIRPVGGTKEYKVNARLIAATNRDLLAMIRTGQFREDLYYRLRGFVIPTHPLRSHPEDIPVIANFLWDKITRGSEKKLTREVLSELKLYRWPGNVRELKSVLTCLFAMFRCTKRLTVKHLRYTFENLGQTVPQEAPSRSVEKRKRLRKNIASLRHLRQVFEAVRATEVTIEPFLDALGEDTSSETYISLQYRIEELNMLCLYPLRFNNQAVFDKVNDLKSKLLFFQELLKEDPSSAISHWKENASDQFNSVLSVLTDEIKKVIKLGSS